MNRTIRHQRGAVAIIVALSIGVLVAMVGLAIDLGRMFVIKTELQNAADACALAAARELNGGADAITRADAAGILIGHRNPVNFQDETPTITTENITYSAALSPNNAYSRSVSPTLAEYVMCSLSRPNIGMLFMAVRGLGFSGIGPQTVNAYAVATLAPGQTTCAVPIGTCQPTTPDDPTDPFGLQVGKWYLGKYGTNAGQGESLTGSFNWIDFSPPGSGTSELRDLLSGAGQCELPPVGHCVGEQGQKTGAVDAWNTRFGMYKGGMDPDDSPPDFTGLAYTVSGLGGADATTWPNPAPQNAYKGTCMGGCSTRNFTAAALAHDPYQTSSPNDPADIYGGGGTGGYNILSSGELTDRGQQRRIAVSPVVDCTQLGSSSPGCPTQQVKILGYACVLMLKPIKGPNDVVNEYLGPANDPNSPCGSYGLAGGSGPLIPVLVQ